jgi:hypothetical protein
VPWVLEAAALSLVAALLKVCSEAAQAFCFAGFAAKAGMRAGVGWLTQAGAQGGHLLWAYPISLQSQNGLRQNCSQPCGLARQGERMFASLLGWIPQTASNASGPAACMIVARRQRSSLDPSFYRAQAKPAGGWRATVSGHDAGRGCNGDVLLAAPIYEVTPLDVYAVNGQLGIPPLRENTRIQFSPKSLVSGPPELARSLPQYFAWAATSDWNISGSFGGCIKRSYSASADPQCWGP